MNKKIAVLGCGIVGTAVVRDLAGEESFQVLAVDLSEANLGKLADLDRVETRKADLGDHAQLVEILRACDLAVGVIPGALGYQTLRTVIEEGKPYCDTSFMTEDALELDDLAREKGVTAVVDCGTAPGLSNMIVGHVHNTLDETYSVKIYVGGLPKVRQWPYEYKAVFSPSDVIEEYIRPARLIEHGELVVKPALSDPELIDFPGVGTLEAFNTDGLRSLITTIKAPFMLEKTLRYPGHVQLVRALRDSGFFDKSHIEVNGVRVRPIDVTSKLLFSLWQTEEGEEEFIIMKVQVEGRKGGKHMKYTYELYDEYDEESGMPSMARTTGFTCAIVTRLLAEGRIAQPGVLPPELLTRDSSLLDHVTGELEKRGVMLDSEISELG